MQVRDRVRQFVVGNFLYGRENGLKDEDSFLDSGIIDSTGVLELVMFLEEGFGIKVQDSDLVPENLDSIERLTRYLERQLGAADGGA